ncbi:MAG: hypothetical protein LWX56_01105, partial [Ignavibacteria bacterium]|nr:hypothetical protein [Ignavibacteria bacterium]
KIIGYMTEKEFVQKQVEILGKKIKKFPGDFVDQAEAVKKLNLPAARLNLGEELFGNYELIDTTGTTHYTARDIYEAKYIVYCSQAGISDIQLPEKPAVVQSSIQAYTRYLDTIIKDIGKDYAKEFPAGKNGLACMNDILRFLNVVRF